MKRIRNLLADQEGATLVQSLLVFPVLVLVVLGGYQVWKAHSVRESLRSGTYQAARYLSINPNVGSWIGTVRDDFVVPELVNNTLLGRDVSERREVAEQVVIFAPHPDLLCNQPFTIRAELPWRVVIPFVERDDWRLVSQYEGRIVCAP